MPLSSSSCIVFKKNKTKPKADPEPPSPRVCRRGFNRLQLHNCLPRGVRVLNQWPDFVHWTSEAVQSMYQGALPLNVCGNRKTWHGSYKRTSVSTHLHLVNSYRSPCQICSGNLKKKSTKDRKKPRNIYFGKSKN